MDTFFTLLVSSITGVVTFLVGQRRAKREIESLALDNINKSLDIYNKIIDSLKDEIIELTKRVKELETKIDDLKTENESLRNMLKNNK